MALPNPGGVVGRIEEMSAWDGVSMWIHLTARTLADLLAPLGVQQITVDPGRPADRPYAPRTPMATAKASSMAPMATNATLTGQPRRP